jgi:hypothetical protein
MKFFRNLSRILIGIVFIFSSIVKGVDPLGTAYRIEDYFLAFHMPWALPFALFLSIFLCTAEFAVGVSMLFNLYIKYISWLLLAMMIYFTALTFGDMMWSPVPDCGCFGDAIKLTNTQTFLKNVVLFIFVIPVFAGRKKFRSPLYAPVEFGLLILFILAFAGMSLYSYRHLPLIDFMAWKKGNIVNKEKPLPVKYYLTYKNSTTGEEKEYLSPNYPWNDSVWVKNWKFKSQRVVNPNTSNLLTLRIEDMRGFDFTRPILDNPDPHFIIVSWNLDKADKESFVRLLPLYKKLYEEGYSFACITSAMPKRVKQFQLETGADFDFYNADDIVLKTMVRSNPGLILMKDGKVIEKWGHRDWPSYEVVEKLLKPKL